MLGKLRAVGKWNDVNSWQIVCYQSNAAFTGNSCVGPRWARHDLPKLGKYLILLLGRECILWSEYGASTRARTRVGETLELC
jgi:hypothetical protein